jgi:protease IV
MAVLRWIARFFAIVGFLTVLLIALVIGIGVYAGSKAPVEPATVVLKLDFEKPIVEQASSSPFDFAVEASSTPLIDILHALDTAAADPHVKGVVAYFGDVQPALAQAQEIRAALARFRKSGKFTYAYGAGYGSFGSGNRVYYLASGFENIWLQPVGSVSLTGLAIQSPFFKGALEKAGVAPDFTRREEYKSVMEMATESTFTPPVRENMQSMMNDLAEQEAAGIADSRKWDVAKVKQLMETGPYTGDEAFKAGLITRVGYADELRDEMKQKTGGTYKETNVEDYLSYSNNDDVKANAKAEVALIYGTGLITDRAVDTSIMDDEIMGADAISKAFNDAAADSKVKAIVFRIDSPGGSPQASETIRRAMIHAEKAGKPVFVTMGAVAASGGYWIAMNADHIVAEPGTLTGSIGVVAGKFVVAGLMQKLGVTMDNLSTNGNTAIWSITEPFTPAQRARLDALVDDSYHAFVSNVSAARKIPLETMPSVAKGRVFTGAQASKNGLVDELGGYDVTLAAVRKKLNLTADDQMTLQEFPAPETPTEKIMALFKKMGVDSVFFGQAMSGWHNLQARIDPALIDAVNVQPVMARAPSPVLGLVK